MTFPQTDTRAVSVISIAAAYASASGQFTSLPVSPGSAGLYAAFLFSPERSTRGGKTHRDQQMEQPTGAASVEPVCHVRHDPGRNLRDHRSTRAHFPPMVQAGPQHRESHLQRGRSGHCIGGKRAVHEGSKGRPWRYVLLLEKPRPRALVGTPRIEGIRRKGGICG